MSSVPVSACPFCAWQDLPVILELPLVVAIWDAFPVTRGHALIVPRRHIATLFDASADERRALFDAIDAVCAEIRARYGPVNDFNFGINSGAEAGQTVPHLHLHVIPRRRGDVGDPRGGVRHVIPARGNPIAETPAPSPPDTIRGALKAADAATGRRSFVLHDIGDSLPRAAGREPLESADTTDNGGPGLFTNEAERTLLPALERDLAQASSVDVAVAFVKPSGARALYPHLEDLLARQGTLRLLTGDYLGITDPDALLTLLDLQALFGGAQVQLRMYESHGVSFHPKAWVLARDQDDGVAFVGSSNLSASALTSGVEWNVRISAAQSRAAITPIRRAFERLFGHPATTALTSDWVARYRVRRKPPVIVLENDKPPADAAPDEGPDESVEVPMPNAVQQAALDALQDTRSQGNKAGLVVMATGLGKTWLAAFDAARPEFGRILFVAHRDEILRQALASFRRIRPAASAGLFMGDERVANADMVFASVQTLSRMVHLTRFEPRAFDYIVIDEFHHASARTYRRIIDHFEPMFLLGLTATPERSDGGDLMTLCGENLVYRCMAPQGIQAGLLCTYRYFGVPDDVDYENIPWRSSRFDEAALTAAVATVRRADNIVAQWRKRGGARTIAFCVSQRHAEFMRAHFIANGIASTAVHAGPGSDGRALSLERLASGDIHVVFAVDMFNEGVDVPSIDTVMMLRPTESQIVWMQQFGRGLRKHGDKQLTVIDYIGNHRSFLTKLRALLGVNASAGKRALSAAFDRVCKGEFELPPGCSVTYELQVIDILQALIGPSSRNALEDHYRDFRDRHGARPSAAQMRQDGYQVRSIRASHGSWFGFVAAMGDLDAPEQSALASSADFLAGLEIMKMVGSDRMLVLHAMLNTDTLPGEGIDMARLTREFRRLAERSKRLLEDVGAAMGTAMSAVSGRLPGDDAALSEQLVKNPLQGLMQTDAAPGHQPFAFDGQRFRCTLPIEAGAREAFQRLVRELVEWRLDEYQAALRDRGEEHEPAGYVLKVRHADNRPVLVLPDRAANPGLPAGGVELDANGVAHTAYFGGVAVDAIRPVGARDGVNVLPPMLRAWFGPDAGLPGTDHTVTLREEGGQWSLAPLQRRAHGELELHRRYPREQIPPCFGDVFSQAIWNSGFIVIAPAKPRVMCLLVTLGKDGMLDAHQYGDRFIDALHFQWQSQNRTGEGSKHGLLIREHAVRGIQVHLFVRRIKRQGAVVMPFTYLGELTYEGHIGEKPMTVEWRLVNPVPEKLLAEFSVVPGAASAGQTPPVRKRER